MAPQAVAREFSTCGAGRRSRSRRSGPSTSHRPAESRDPAEQETALLAATGYSSKEIAQQLNLSARTIDNRLRRIYEKLGISSRSTISDALQ